MLMGRGTRCARQSNLPLIESLKKWPFRALPEGSIRSPVQFYIKVTADIRALAFRHCSDAISKLVAFINSENEHTATRIAAAKELLDRGIGKAAQPQNGEGGEGPVEIHHIVKWRGWNPGE